MLEHRDRVQDLLGGPVFTSLTEEESAELSRKVAEANKRSENGGGR